jgi:hypothetical protein
MSEHRCTVCASGKMYRSGRRGLWETYILPMVGKYPWRCGFCRTRVSLADRGEDNQYVRSNRPVPKDNEAEGY